MIDTLNLFNYTNLAHDCAPFPFISTYISLQCVDTDDDKHVGRSGVAVRTSDSQSRKPGFE